MKQISKIILLFICLQVAFVSSLTAQRMIKIDGQLKDKSQAMIAKRKGFRAVGKYEFGPYKVISGKANWTKGFTNSPLFGRDTYSGSSTKKSFVLINDKADTCIANILVVVNIQTEEKSSLLGVLLNQKDFVVNEGEGIYETVFSFSNDTTQWKLDVIYPLSVEQDGISKRDNHTKFKGVLTADTSLIEIREVDIINEGNNSFLNPVKGYEFWQDDVSVAAVQFMPMNRMFVRIRNDLDESFQFILSSAVVAVLMMPY